MSTSGGGWTVFQRRIDGSVDFYLDWKNYTEGFGNLSGEFWLGLDKIYRLSKNGQNVLRIDLEDFENDKRYANYSTFTVANEPGKYRLNVAGYSGQIFSFIKSRNIIIEWNQNVQRLWNNRISLFDQCVTENF